MPKRNGATISRKAYARAEADFTTWLMMAKLGSFENLGVAAQDRLMSYRRRLEANQPEAEATAATINDMYLAYYTEMGGEGEAPQIVRTKVVSEHMKPRLQANVVELKNVKRAPHPAPSGRQPRKMPAALLFAAMVAVIAVIKLALGW